MGFKETLKDEIKYKGLMIKEVAAKAGVSNSTFLSYIDSRAVLPNVITAVKIAQVLGVSVEYLVTGNNPDIKNSNSKEIKDLLFIIENLNDEKLKIAKTIIHAIADM
ncbi:MAG: helix-turn-helix transcriptional regulator [Treponema sp.]|nr:helix-turn-helix transcriptional regulator [Treponema sp.]MBR5647313.1 helix-turn-helix transcriptional regulator [Treponema sp.]